MLTRRITFRRSCFAVLLSMAAMAAGQAPAPQTRPPARPSLVAQLGSAYGFTSVAFSPDGRRLITGSDDDTTTLWDVETGMVLRTLVGPTRSWWSHILGVSSVAFSPDGKMILTGSRDKTAELWDAETGREIHTLRGHSDEITSVAFSPDGRTALTGSKDKTARLWDVAAGQELRVFSGYQDAVTSVAYSPDGGSVVAVSDDGTGKFWNASTGSEIFPIAGRYAFKSVAFSHDGNRIVTGGSDTIARLWDANTGKEIRAFTGHTESIFSVAFSPSDRVLLTESDDSTRLWNADSGDSLGAIDTNRGYPVGAAFSPDGASMLIGFSDYARIWNLKTGKPGTIFQGDSNPLKQISLSADGTRMLVLSTTLRMVAQHVKGDFGKSVEMRLWDLETGRVIRAATTDIPFGSDGVLAPDGRMMLAGSDGKGSAELSDPETGHPILALQGHTDQITGIAFSRDGRRVLTGSWDGTAKLWDTSTGRVIRTFRVPAAPVGTVALSPDGHQAVTCSGDRDESVKLWDADTGQAIRIPAVLASGSSVVIFSPDGRWILTNGKDNNATLWSARTGQRVRTFIGHAEEINSAAFAPDSRTVLTGSGDNTAKLWDVDTGREIRTLRGHLSPIMSVVFAPNGRTVFTGSYDGTGKLWDVSTGQELATVLAFSDKSWAVVDPEGRYDASNGGDIDGLHWVVGDTAIGLSQLKQRYYDPGLLAKYTGFNKEPLVVVETFDDPKLFPQVAIEAPVPGSTTLQIHLADQGGGIGKVRVLVNGKEIAADARGSQPGPDAVQSTLHVDLAGAAVAPGQDNKIEVVAWNADGYLASRGVSVNWQAPGSTATATRPDLYAIVAGISAYADPHLGLNFSGHDADSFARALQLGADRLFGAGHTHIAVLTSTGSPGETAPTKENLHQAFVAAQKARPGDVFVIYLAGHGVALSHLYAYPTSDARTLDLSDPAIRAQTAVTSDELVDWIKKIPATHQVMILDTCAAGAAAAKLVEKRDVPGDQIRALDQLKDRTGFYVLMGSAADAVSYEASKYGQGLLTYALLTGMKGAALKNDVDVDVSKLFQFAVDDVPGLAAGIGGVQRPQIIAPTGGASFDVGQLEPEDQKQIPLAAEKPIFLRPQLVNAEGPDDLDLAPAVRRALRNATWIGTRGGPMPEAIFVDEDEMPGAIRIGGTYVVEQNRVTAQIWLSRDNAKKRIVVQGSTTDVAAFATRISAAILDSGKDL